MTDLASLQIKVESQQVKDAIQVLSGLAREGDRAEKQTDDLSKSTRKLSSESGELANQVRGIITRYVGLGVAVTTLKRLSSASLEAAAAIERHSVSMGVLLGDMSLGADLFREIEEFSARTPMAVNDLSEAVQMLMSFGIESEEVMGTLQTLGDVALGNAGKLESLSRAYGRVVARGRASMEEVNIAMEAGVPIISELSKAMDSTEAEIFDLISAGKVSASTFQEAFKSMTSEGGQFNNGMEILSQTFEGKLSTAMDNVRLLGATMFEPAIERGKTLLDTATGIAQSLRNTVDMGRLDRSLNRGDVAMSDLSTEDQLGVMRYRLQQQLNEQQQILSAGGLNTDTIQRIQARIDMVDSALDRVRDGADKAGDIIQREIEQALERASQTDPPPWFAELEYGFLDSTSGIERRIDREFDKIDRLGVIYEQIGQDFDVFGEKAEFVHGIIEELIGLDPTEFGGSWEEAYRLADPSVQNLIELYEELLRKQQELTRGGTPWGPEWDVASPALDAAGRAMGRTGSQSNWDQSGIDGYIDNLDRQRKTLGMNNLELIEYEMSMMGATDAEILHAQNIQMSIDRQKVFKESLTEIAMIAGGEFLDTFNEIGASLYGAGDAASAFENNIWDMVDAVINALPNLLFMAGVQLIGFGQWQIGLGLIAASGLAAIGAGAWNAHVEQKRSELEGRASGGPVTAGTAYMVGEHGPEPFIPQTSGYILSNATWNGMMASGGGGGSNVNIQIINQVPGVVVERKETSGPSGKDIQLFIKSATKEAIARGEMDDVLGGRYGLRKQGVARS
nr:hypothetical protein 9 [Spirochaetaceae bacterium]